MVNLPHRFVPTTSKFVSPVRIVAQRGHDAGITAVSFSPCTRYFASADENGWLRIWCLETLDILGIYLLGFKCDKITWNGLSSVSCRGGRSERVISFSDEVVEDKKIDDLSNNVIRLLDAPEVSRKGDSVVVLYCENEFVHEVPGLIDCRLEPCERYVAVLAPQAVSIFSAFDENVLFELKANEGSQWCAMHVSWRGDFVYALQNDGSIWCIDPVALKSTCLYRGRSRITASAFGEEKFAILGDERGNITVYDIAERSLVLRTPRSPIEFEAVYPASEKAGFVALRSESATAFFEQSNEILSASPLPAAYRASCAGSLFSEIIVACDDDLIYRLKLDDNSISKICKTTKIVDALACSGDVVFVHYTDGSSAFIDGHTHTEHAWKSKKLPLSMAVSENGKTAAALFADHIDILDVAGKKDVIRVDIKGGTQILCGKEKTANQLIVMMSDLRVMTVDMRSGACSELNRIDIDYGRIVAVAPAAKSFCHVLVAGEHGQYIVFKVGLNTGKSSIILRVMTLGTQIYGASSSEKTVSLRNDATCLRIISGLKAYSIEDWSRSEPLQIF